MKFTLVTLFTLVAAATAVPSAPAAPPTIISQKSQKEINALKNKCGDLTINCCIAVDKGDESADNTKGLVNLVGHLIGADAKGYCTAAPVNGLLDHLIDLDLFGEKDAHLCDNANVVYACCTSDSDCEVVGGHDDDKKKDNKEIKDTDDEDGW
ncbi:hypothetical protein BJX70DRAFT_172382 [Aspergillus crustosus]